MPAMQGSVRPGRRDSMEVQMPKRTDIHKILVVSDL